MRYRWLGALLLALLWFLIRLDPVRTGVAVLLIYGGFRLAHSGGRPPEGRRTLVGTVHRMDREYPFQGLALSCAIADVKIDLSRAIIPPGEHLLRIDGLVGDVDIYLPYDLEVSVSASAAVPGRRERFTTPGYAEAVSKVKIDVSLGLGDVDVRRL